MPDDSKHDLTTLGRVARTPEERRDALMICLTQFWAQEDAVRLERRDEPQWNGWDLWRRAAAATAAADTPVAAARPKRARVKRTTPR